MCEKCDGKWSVPSSLSQRASLTIALFHSPNCDSYVRPAELVRICDECSFGSYAGRCIICGSPGTFFEHSPSIPSLTPISSAGISDAYYCAVRLLPVSFMTFTDHLLLQECVRLEKSRDGCPKIVNLGSSRIDLFYERKKLG